MRRGTCLGSAIKEIDPLKEATGSEQAGPLTPSYVNAITVGLPFTVKTISAVGNQFGHSHRCFGSSSSLADLLLTQGRFAEPPCSKSGAAPQFLIMHQPAPKPLQGTYPTL